MQPVFIAGEWRESEGRENFQAVNPQTGEKFPEQYPVSPAADIERAIEAAATAFTQVRGWTGDRFAEFLERFAETIEDRTDLLSKTAHQETGLPVSPRLKEVELPRTTNQLRQAATAARDGSWALPTIDTQNGIRSCYRALGPVTVFGPNNFPLAFNAVSGGDFAAAVAAGNPVIAKAHPSHPGTSRILAEAAHEAIVESGMPDGFVQMVYHMGPAEGERLVSHPAIGAAGFTGSRRGGLALKAAADRAGKPIYLEMSSINPLFVLPGALAERQEQVLDELAGSCLLGAGQFCTQPGFVVLPGGEVGERFLEEMAEKFRSASPGTLLNAGVLEGLNEGVRRLIDGGAKVVVGGEPQNGEAFAHQNTLLRVTGSEFLKNAEVLQSEAFGNAAILVLADDQRQMVEIANLLEGNLTGSIYSAGDGSDDDWYAAIEPPLRQRVGRLLNDKMPTGVAVSAAMNHGGPFPATGHPGFTAVGIPASVRRFAMLACYDNVRPQRLPLLLRDENAVGAARLVNGEWTRERIG